ncbi:DUF3265 domain-containing protein [Vibrio vulnificus]|nr:DUF3265 domain-containing protein [Vibrio vulnificus]
MSKLLTRRSSGIHAAWHFWFAVSFSGESGLRKVGLGGIHPLTRRYNAKGVQSENRHCSDANEMDCCTKPYDNIWAH